MRPRLVLHEKQIKDNTIQLETDLPIETQVLIFDRTQLIGKYKIAKKEREDTMIKATLKELKALDFKDLELEDDNTLHGGVSYQGETLEDFLLEIGEDLDLPLVEVNKILKDNGIKTI